MNSSKTVFTNIGEVPRFPVYELNDSDWKNGIVVRSPNWLGDAIMTFPALVQLKKIIPEDKKLIILCPPGLRKLYETMNLVDEVFALSRAHSSWSIDEIKKLKSFSAGVGLLFNNSPRDVIYFRIAGISRLFGASARCRGILMTRAFRYPKRVKGLNHFQHSAKYLSMAYALGAPDWNGELPEFTLEKDTLSDGVRRALNSEKLMVIAGGAAYGPAKRWPAENYRTVAEYWIGQGGYAVTLGTESEKEIGDRILQGLPPVNSENLAGKTDLTELMMLLQKADFCVANDSGTMHLSAALGGRGLAVYGSTDPTATAPISDKWKILYEQEKCSPCFRRECPLDSYRCLTKITPEKVIGYISEFTE